MLSSCRFLYNVLADKTVSSNNIPVLVACNKQGEVEISILAILFTNHELYRSVAF